VKIGKSSDTSALSWVGEISREIVDVFATLESKYEHVDVELFYVFRCLPDAIGRKTSRRFSKSENVLYLDMQFSQERLAPMSRDEQRWEVSHQFFDYTAQSLAKYRLAGLAGLAGLDVEAFLTDLRSLCHEIGWLKEDWQVDL
jgi:hypothetical protein